MIGIKLLFARIFIVSVWILDSTIWTEHKILVNSTINIALNLIHTEAWVMRSDWYTKIFTKNSRKNHVNYSQLFPYNHSFDEPFGSIDYFFSSILSQIGHFISTLFELCENVCAYAGFLFLSNMLMLHSMQSNAIHVRWRLINFNSCHIVANLTIDNWLLQIAHDMFDHIVKHLCFIFMCVLIRITQKVSFSQFSSENASIKCSDSYSNVEQ